MNPQAIQLSDVLDYSDFINRKKEFINVAGRIDMHPAQLQWLYERQYYIIAYRSIMQIYYRPNQPQRYVATEIYRATADLTPYTLRGRHTYARAKEINEWLGFELLADNIY